MSIEKIQKLSNLGHKEWERIVESKMTKKLDKNLAMRDLVSMKKVLDKNGVNFWLTGGTLLGLFRDSDFISFDDDVDVAVYEEEFLLKYDVLKQEFIEEGFIFRAVKKTMGTKINLYRYGKSKFQKNSIDGLFLCEKYKNNKFRLSRTKKYPKKYFETFGTITFNDIVFRIPTPPEKYLSSVYSNWRKKIKNAKNQHKWRNSKVFWKVKEIQ